MKKLTEAERKAKVEARERIAAAYRAAWAKGIREAHEEKMAKKAEKKMTRLQAVKILKDIAKNGTALGSGHPLAAPEQLAKDAAALEFALDFIRDYNVEDEGSERFCPVCEKRLAPEGVCMRCDSDMAEATPGHRTT